MKQNIAIFLVIGFVASALVLGRKGSLIFLPTLHAQTVRAEEGCSVASLNSAYGFFRTGTTAIGPLGIVGIATFDGAGTSTAIQTIRKNGVTTSDLFTDPAFTSTYEFEPNCAGKFLIARWQCFCARSSRGSR